MSALSTQAILQGMADALPTHNASDDSSDLASSYEAIALLIHAYLAALDFRLCGFDEDKTLRESSLIILPMNPDHLTVFPLSEFELTLTRCLAECESLKPRLPPQWNNGFGSLSFVYAHKQSSMRFIFRVDRMGAKVEIRGLAVGDENIHRFERTVRDVIRSDALPIRIPMNGEEEDRSGLENKLKSVFVSEQAITGKSAGYMTHRAVLYDEPSVDIFSYRYLGRPKSQNHPEAHPQTPERRLHRNSRGRSNRNIRAPGPRIPQPTPSLPNR